MSRLYKKIHKVGLPPGTLLDAKDLKKEQGRMRLIEYDDNHLDEKDLNSAEEIFPSQNNGRVTWLNLDRRDKNIIERIGVHWKIHSLVLEDILNSGQRPKIEDYGDYIFVVMKMLYFENGKESLFAEQISFVVGKDYLFSFQERPGDVLDPVRLRIHEHKGRIRASGADYLLYALLDIIIDHYFVVLEKIGDQIEKLEDKLIRGFDRNITREIYHLKRNMIFIRKQIWPMREVLSGLMRNECPLIEKSTMVFVRDAYDHSVHVMETVDAFRDMLSGLHDIYLSLISNKMNEIMKVLTIFAAIFIPLTFVAGIYGMNFEYMPELKWKWGYFGILSLMGLMAVAMMFYFKKKRWL